MADSSLEVWKRKLEALRVAEATASTAAQKFELAEQIKQAEAKIAELERGNVTVHSSPLVAPSRLTTAPERLVGRNDELRRLGEAWGDSGTHVVSIVAWGGAGKSSLVAKWAGELATRGYDGASYFDWSFYSQGTREQAGASSQASSDSFIAAALEFFGAAELVGSPDAVKLVY